MGADYSFEVKNIEIWVPAFFKHNNSYVATMIELFFDGDSQVLCPSIKAWFIPFMSTI